MVKNFGKICLIGLCSLLMACGGWHLRGANTGSDSRAALNNRIYLKANNARYIGTALRKELRNRGATLTSARGDADIVVEVFGQRYQRDILSIDPENGKVREIELGLTTEFVVRAGTGELLVPRETVTWQIDYVFDEGSVLGTTEQDKVVQRDLAENAATAIALRVAAVRLPDANASSTPATESGAAEGE